MSFHSSEKNWIVLRRDEKLLGGKNTICLVTSMLFTPKMFYFYALTTC